MQTGHWPDLVELEGLRACILCTRGKMQKTLVSAWVFPTPTPI
jgi:hypothetical protein